MLGKVTPDHSPGILLVNVIEREAILANHLLFNLGSS